jgi:hypothetical protein
MPTLLYNLELTEEEIFHLWALLAMRQLSIGPLDLEEISILEKVKELMEV